MNRSVEKCSGLALSVNSTKVGGPNRGLGGVLDLEFRLEAQRLTKRLSSPCRCGRRPLRRLRGSGKKAADARAGVRRDESDGGVVQKLEIVADLFGKGALALLLRQVPLVDAQNQGAPSS